MGRYQRPIFTVRLCGDSSARSRLNVCSASGRAEVSEWGTVIPDPRLVAVIVDRFTYNAHILETGTDSYRLATTRRLIRFL